MTTSKIVLVKVGWMMGWQKAESFTGEMFQDKFEYAGNLEIRCFTLQTSTVDQWEPACAKLWGGGREATSRRVLHEHPRLPDTKVAPTLHCWILSRVAPAGDEQRKTGTWQISDPHLIPESVREVTELITRLTSKTKMFQPPRFGAKSNCF